MGLRLELGFVVNPIVQRMEESKLDSIMAGNNSAVHMMEGHCDFLTEDQMLEVSFLGTSHPVPGMSFAVPGTSLACFPGTSLADPGMVSAFRDISCFPGTHLLQNSQCTYMLVG